MTEPRVSADAFVEHLGVKNDGIDAWIAKKEMPACRVGQPMRWYVVVDGKVAYMSRTGFKTARYGHERGSAVSNTVHPIDDTLVASQCRAGHHQMMDAARVTRTDSRVSAL